MRNDTSDNKSESTVGAFQAPAEASTPRVFRSFEETTTAEAAQAELELWNGKSEFPANVEEMIERGMNANEIDIVIRAEPNGKRTPGAEYAARDPQRNW